MIPIGVILHILIVICIYGILAIGLNVIMGTAGLFTIAHAALFGVGAYAAAILALAGLPFWVDTLAAVALAGGISFFIGLPTIKLRGDYLAVATMGTGEILVAVFRNWDSVTRGPMGLPGIPPPALFGFKFDTDFKYLVLSLVCLAIVYVVANRLIYSPYGRVLKALRMDEGTTMASGKNTYWAKMWIFVIGGSFAGLAGSLYAHYISYIDPASFTLALVFFLWLIIILGGLGNNLGTILGCIVFVTLREGLRFVGLPGNVTAAVQELLFGVLLICMTIFARRGLIPEAKYVRQYRPDAPDHKSGQGLRRAAGG
jgi:branched-chain amino acid transport system permease protein